MPTNVFVVEPDAVIRQNITELIDGHGSLRVARAVGRIGAPSGDDESCSVDVFLADVSAIEAEGAALRRLLLAYPDAYLLLCGDHSDLNALLNTQEMPLRGYVLLKEGARQCPSLLQALETVADGGAYLDPVMARLVLGQMQRACPAPVPAPPRPLTYREAEVLRLVRLGLTNKGIALQMGLRLGTVRSHLRNIFRKLNVGSRTSAALQPTE